MTDTLVPLGRVIVFESGVLPPDRNIVAVFRGYRVRPEWDDAQVIHAFMLDRWIELGYVTFEQVEAVYLEAKERLR